MPFADPADLDTPEKFEKLLKLELNKLDGDPSEFFFCEDYPMVNKMVDNLVVGKIKKPVIHAMKTKGTAPAGMVHRLVLTGKRGRPGRPKASCRTRTTMKWV